MGPKKMCQKEQLIAALSGTIKKTIFRLSRIVMGPKKSARKQLIAALSGTIFFKTNFRAISNIVMGPKKVPERAADSCSLWHHFCLLNQFSGYLKYSHGTKKKVPQRAADSCSLWHHFFC